MELERKVDEIHKALCGTEYSKGLLERIDRLERESFVHKIAISVATVFSGVLAFILGK